MSFTINNKEYRNIQEQVQKNKADIEELRNLESVLNAYGIKVVGSVASSDLLPESGEEFGDAYTVGTEPPYDIYVWTRGNDEEPEDHWLNLGPIAIVGPQGAQGEQGIQGLTGDTGLGWVVGQGAPSGLLEGQPYLDYLTGNIYQGEAGGSYTLLSSIIGPQGIQGIRGPAGPQGPRGYTGETGAQGETGAAIIIRGSVASADDLPDPTFVVAGSGYLVGASAPYHLYAIEGATTEQQQWIDTGPFNDPENAPSYLTITGDSGTFNQEELTLLATTDNVWLKEKSTDLLLNETSDLYRKVRQGALSMDFVKVGYSIITPALYIITVNPATGTWAKSSIDLQKKLTAGTGISIVGDTISATSTGPEYVTITPDTATSGTLTTEQFNKLAGNRENKIVLADEIYELNDDQHESGYQVYSHVGHDSSNNYYIKCITLTLSTQSWVLSSTQVGGGGKLYLHNIEMNMTVTDADSFIFQSQFALGNCITIINNSSEAFTIATLKSYMLDKFGSSGYIHISIPGYTIKSGNYEYAFAVGFKYSSNTKFGVRFLKKAGENSYQFSNATASWPSSITDYVYEL